jgi:hypothetical protein
MQEFGVVSYTIYSVREVPVGPVRRTEVAVVVEPGATRAELVEVAEQIAEDRRSAADYDALVVGFFDYADFIDRGPYSLGRWEHAPPGQWAHAGAGLPNYSNFRAADHLQEKDWAKRPDAEMVRLWREWFEVLDQLDKEHGTGNHEAAAYRTVAERNNLQPEDVQAACQRVTVWPYV